MADEPVVIEATAGPYAGQRLTVSPAEAKQAIADGWARDPFAPPSDEPPPEMDQDARDKMLVAAEKAAKKLRGEEEADDGKTAKKAAEDKPAAGDETRGVKKK